MYLKEIKMFGFKSFAEKTSIEFDSKITGVVGPNGSGKSNIVDAVRWVLGEQSIKSLRGSDNMTDVIFSGSKSRNPLNMASVTLVFDNSDKHLPTSYEEVSIKRTIYKSGENEYTMNNEKCRLKDITDLLLDSGSSKEAFNIISQGKVQEILSTHPDERRIIFEEASGVLKYKKRKDEAIRKLDRTNNNMTRIKDILNELEVQVAPLLEQSIIAKKYLEYKTELESIEIALIASDIETINYEYQNMLKRIEEINEEITMLSTTTSTSDATLEKTKVELQTLENIIFSKNSKLIEVTKETESLNSEKKIIIERKKYEVDDQKLHNNLIILKENELNTKSNISSINQEIEITKTEFNSITLTMDVELKNQTELKIKKQNQFDLLNLKIKEDTIILHNIERLKDAIESNTGLSYGVKAVLNNPKLNGIKNIIGKLIETKEEYATAIDIALGGAKEYIIVENEKNAKEGINYLKNNNLGRATFFPMSVIKGRYIDRETLSILEKTNGFIGIAANLITYKDEYSEIMNNQLGNIVIAKNIDLANEISKVINHKYRIVTLDGDLINVGGSLTGGSIKKTSGMIKEKYELEKLIKDKELLKNELVTIDTDLNKLNEDYQISDTKLNEIMKKRLVLDEIINSKLKTKLVLEESLLSITKELEGTNKTLDNSLSNEEVKVMDLYHEKELERSKIEKELEDLNKQKNNLKETINEIETTIKKENSMNSKKYSDLKELEIKTSRMDVKLDNLLNTLSEDYSMTFDHAKELYKLEIDINIARPKVASLKNEIRNLGVVNIGAIEEYDRVNTRFEFLNTQKEELDKAEATLLEIIKEMDDVMEVQFKETFELIKEQFKITFKELFNGGSADLKLTDPDNILTTGIEIIASPPGKKLTTITLLSGGEKTLTAIALLFAILKVRPVPYCILDEVEAALDEVNVDKFGHYLETFRNKTQFIIITHKKKTMEYADSLYGITMPESGVSKLVSVHLEELK